MSNKGTVTDIGFGILVSVRRLARFGYIPAKFEKCISEEDQDDFILFLREGQTIRGLRVELCANGTINDLAADKLVGHREEQEQEVDDDDFNAYLHIYVSIPDKSTGHSIATFSMERLMQAKEEFESKFTEKEIEDLTSIKPAVHIIYEF